MESYLNDLNEKQFEAVHAVDGRIKVAAGAGSGKTKVLASRYAYLVNAIGISASHILCLTFTNKAAGEMKGRIAKLLPPGEITDFICTFHGFCVKVLRKEIYRIGYPKNFTIIDDEDSKTLANQVFQECGISRSKNTITEFVKSTVPSYKGCMKDKYVEELLLPNAAKNVMPRNLIIEKAEQDTLKRFINLQQKNYALDFQDLIYCTTYILRNFEEARKYWQKQFDYILVDEAQDCNESEWILLDILAEKNNNLFVVGDPDQAIYEWRGARPDLFVNYISDKIFLLEKNYRSTPNILDVANSIIKNNRNRIEKNLFTENNNGEIVIHHHAKSEPEEAVWIARTIKTMINSGASPDDFAILYRASYISRGIEQAFMQESIPYVVWGGIRFFERKEIKDILAYLKLAAFDDNLSFERIVNVPSRKFGKKSLEKLKDTADVKESSLFETLRVSDDIVGNKDNMLSFINLILSVRSNKNKMSLSDLLELVLYESGLESLYRNDGDEERLENITELQNFVEHYESVNKEEEVTLESFLQDISLYTNVDKSIANECVKLMTVHQSKGLEFPYVFIVELNEGIFPNYKAVRYRKENGLEEERRLMYVASTRAEKMLFLAESEGFNFQVGINKYPSRFILEIEDRLIKVDGDIEQSLYEETRKLIALQERKTGDLSTDFNMWDYVVHDHFGEGAVVSVNPGEESCEVLFFKERKTRHLKYSVLKYVSIQNIIPNIAWTEWEESCADDIIPTVTCVFRDTDFQMNFNIKEDTRESVIANTGWYTISELCDVKMDSKWNAASFIGHYYGDYIVLKEDSENSELVYLLSISNRSYHE